MTSKDPKNNTALAKASYGMYARREWSITGTNCGAIKAISAAVIKALSPEWKCAYMDTQHAGEEGDSPDLPGVLAYGAKVEYTDKIGFRQFNASDLQGSFRLRQLFSHIDLMLVNGNHHEATAQVVVIDEVKRASLQKRVPRLNNIELVLLADNAESVFDFIQPLISGGKPVPVYKLSDTEKIVDFFRNKMIQLTPPLKGLVLAGGGSVRMGKDKGALVWHDKEQRYHLADLLRSVCEEVFISCLSGQEEGFDTSYKTLADTFTGLGPYGAILSAFRSAPDSAWLVTACDLPLLSRETLSLLTEQRRVSALATAFESPLDSLPEPLITIWEPKSYPILLSFLAQGYSSPRKVLINSDTHLIKPPSPDDLMNVNTPEEAEAVRKILEDRAENSEQ